MKIRSVLLGAFAVVAMLSLAGPAAAAPADVDVKAGVGTYNLIIRTADIHNADTDDSVRITVFGLLDGVATKSPPVQIDQDFGRGTTKKFGPFRWPSIGVPGYISLGKSGRESDAWYPEYVQVHDEHTGGLYTCRVDEWFPQRALTRFYACA